MAFFSHSRINTYENCPLQYKFRYIDRIKTQQEGIEAFMGSRVHEVLEKLYADLQYEKHDELPQLLEFYRRKWQEKWHDQVVIVKPDYAVEDYRNTGERCIKDYYRRYAPFEEGKTLGLEKPVTVNLADGRYLIKGFIDRLVKTADGKYEIHDYKTSKQVPPQYYLDNDRQLALYQLAVEEMWPDVGEVELVWHYLANDAELRSRRTPQQLENLKQKVIKQIQEIEAAESFEPQKSSLCPWCTYHFLCPLKKHLFETERMSAEEFSSDDGVTLVNRFATLKEQERELKSQIDEIKKALMSYVEKENLLVVKGADYKVKIFNIIRKVFPDSERLKKLVKDNELWDAVSKIDDKLLDGLLSSDKLDPELAGQIKEFQQIRHSRYPRAFPLKDLEK